MCSWGGGTFTRANPTWTADAAGGIGIEAGRHDNQDNDFTTGINQCLNKDGSNAATGNLNLGGYLPTNIGAGTAAAPAICAGNDVNTGIFSAAADQIGIATNGTEKIRIDSSGRIGVGTTSPSANVAIDNNTTVQGSYGLNITQYSNDVNGGDINLRKSRSGTIGTNTIVQNGDVVGALRFWGANGTGFDQGAIISAGIDATPGASNDMPTALLFFTRADAAASLTERMRIDSVGNVGIGTSSINGNLDVRTSYNDEDFIVGKSIAGNYYFASKLIARHTTGSAANIFIDVSNNVLVRSTSSAKYKTNIVDYTRGLDAVTALRPVFYKGVNDGEKQFAGLIAEEVHEAGLHEFVVYDADNEPDALHYGNMVALAFKAIQELNVKVEALEARVAELEA